MRKDYILNRVDHTLLAQNATESEILSLLEEALKFKTATVCIPPSYVAFAKSKFKDIKVCTVIGFPNGYSTTAVKVFETQNAVKNGADEIDMVINIGWIKDEKFDEILEEINAVKAVCDGKILKVIIETCLLTDREKIKMCEIVSNSNADYIKTSTGFSSGGATDKDIILFKKHIKNGKKIKAAGGIKNFSDAENFINLGADRLGTSRLCKILTDNN